MSSNLFDLALEDYKNETNNKSPSSNFFDIALNEYQKEQPKQEQTSNFFDTVSRLAMQSGIGLGKGRAFTSAAGIPLALAELSYPGAVKNEMGELLENEREEEAWAKIFGNPVEGPKLIPQKMEEGAEALEKSLLGGEGLVGGLITAPMRAAGIDTLPQGPAEEMLRFFSELTGGFAGSGMNLREAQGLAYDLTRQIGQKISLSNLKSHVNLDKEHWKREINQALDKIMPSRQAKKLQEQVIGENAPKTRYESSETLQKELTTPKIEHPLPEIKVEFPNLTPENQSLMGRVSVQPIVSEKVQSLANKELSSVGETISPRAYRNKAEGGMALKDITQRSAQAEREAVSDLYRRAEDEYKDISGIVPDLYSYLSNMRTNLTKSLKPNTGEQAVLKEIDELLLQIGNPIEGFNPISVERLIKTSDSISGMAKYEMPFNGPKDFLKGISSKLNQAAKNVIQRNGANVDTFNLADQAFSRWAQRFGNDEIAPFLERTNLNPEEVYNKAINFSNPKHQYALTYAFEGNNQAQPFIRMSQRDLVEDALSKFIDNPHTIGNAEYKKIISNLEPVLGKELTQNINNKMYKIKSHTPKKISKEHQKVLEKNLSNKISSHTKDVQNASKYLGKTPEDITKMLDSRHGIKQLRKDAKSDLAKQELKKLEQYKTRSILTEGKIISNPTGKELAKILNSEDNYELLSELIGRTETDALFKAAQQLGEKEVTQQRLLKAGKILGLAKVIKFFY